MNIERYNMYLAALLHGVGNFYQKTDMFLEKLSFGENITLTDFQQAIIRLADAWSCSIDNNNPEKGKQDSLLKPIFQQLLIDSKGASNPNKYVYGLQAMDLGNQIFPKEISLDGGKDVKKAYNALWESFIKEYQKISTDNIAAFAETLLHLLKKYTYYLPANDTNMQAVSLFQHIKMKAAIADCLSVYCQEKTDSFDFTTSTNTIKIKDFHYPLLLFCADISGIQKFIYDIASQKAAVSLKGRSFYLQLLIDSIIQQVIEKAEVMAGHIIYSSGGKFYMLLPNTKSVEKELIALEKKITEELYENVGTSLYVCFGQVAFSMTDTLGICIENEPITDMSALWRAASEATSAKKSRKYEHKLIKDFDVFFGKKGKGIEIYPEKGENAVTCAVTGEIGDKRRMAWLNEIEIAEMRENGKTNEEIEQNKVWVKVAVKQQADLGRELKDADYIVVSNSKIKSDFTINILGKSFHLISKAAVSDIQDGKILSINDTNFLRTDKNVSYGYLFYGGNKQALSLKKDKNNNQIPKEFDVLTLYDDKHASFRRLGVLRMDVDGLGAIFMKGLPEGKKSFAAYATLSAQLDLFFAGYLNTIRNKTAYKDYVNILYSGGDDVFAIGRWDALIAFAAEVRSEFRRFVCGREDISISAGLVLVDGKFPISKAAEMAGEAEERAKAFEAKNGTKKNAICLFDEVVSWENEWDFVVRRKTDLQEWLATGIITKGTLNRIMQFKQMKDLPKRKAAKGASNTKPSFEWIWIAAYYFAKRKRTPQNTILKDFMACGRWKEEQPLGAERGLDLLAIAARWVELEERNKEKIPANT